MWGLLSAIARQGFIKVLSLPTTWGGPALNGEVCHVLSKPHFFFSSSSHQS